MHRSIVFVCIVFHVIIPTCWVAGQVVNTAMMDTAGGEKINRLSIGAYIDAYYGYSTVSQNKQVPYFVSMNRHNEFNINLAFVDVRYISKHVRARIVPGFGTYMNANYAAEPGSLSNLVEANAGIKLSKKKEIWLDAGVLGSPYTNESAISKDHLMYTRSFAPEYVPYYLSGVKLTLPMGSKTHLYLYLINGWQQIQDNNSGKALGTQLEIKLNESHLLNWNTFVGDERSATAPNYRTRYFTDVYWIYNSGKKWSATSSFYIGNQRINNTGRPKTNNWWWQCNAIAQYRLSNLLALAARVEYFNDPNAVQITPPANADGFKSASAGLCLNLHVNKNAMLRFEARHFAGNKNLFSTPTHPLASHMQWLIANVTAWF
jgi:Putative beta-barrel porin-2, OmpL-like. bbp2